MKPEELLAEVEKSEYASEGLISFMKEKLYSEYNKGMLTLIEKYHKKQGIHWMGLYKCECGKNKIIQNNSVKNGLTLSCGCKKRKTGIDTLGKSKSPEYRALFYAISRCTIKDDKAYHNYGGRGIKVCDRWTCKKGFENFLNDMGERPGSEYSIDRIDVNKGYNKENCRWTTNSSQSMNRRGYGYTSNHIGISFNNKEQKWVATIFKDGRYLFNKRFNTEKDAVISRNQFIASNNLPHRLNSI